MTMNNHPITPPDELMREWIDNDDFPFSTGTFDLVSITKDRLRSIATQAACWGNHSAPQPIPVSERWPEFSDCDDAERVWCWSWAIGTWRLSRINRSIHSHWLPAHALPVPSHD